MCNVALISKAGLFPPDQEIDIPAYFAASGRNTGNNAFFTAVSKIVAGTKHYYDWNFDPEVVNKQCDVAIFVSANHINKFSNFGGLPSRLNEISIPLMVIGIGAQASVSESQVETSASVDELLDVLKRKARFVGARGEFTYDFLKRSGFDQALITGCPSNLTNASRTLGVQIAAKLEHRHTLHRVGLCLDVSGSFLPYGRKFRSILEDHGGFVVCQDPIDLIYLSYGRYEKVSQTYMENFKNFFGLNAVDEIKKFCSKYLFTFFDPQHLMHHAKTKTLSYGTKMHGNMLFFQSGTPAIILMHDSRTKELAEFLKLPRLPRHRLNVTHAFASDLDQIEFNGREYDLRRSEQAAIFDDLFRQMEIPSSEHLRGLV